MTLERHRSHLIPDVEYSLDGTLFVTDTGGTFPLRGKGKKHADGRGTAFEKPEPPPTYRSYDPRREDQKRRYKQRTSPNRFAQEVKNISGFSTISTHTSSSLGRRLRRSKRKYASVRGQEYRYSRDKSKEFQFRKDDGYNSVSGGSTGRRLRGGPPRMTPEFAEILKRKKSARSLDLQPLQNGGTLQKKRRASKDAERIYDIDRRLSNGTLHHEKQRFKKIHDEKLPYLVFLIDGIFLMIVGVIRLVMSYWHIYYCPLWAGFLALMLGIIGAKHKGQYLIKGINAAYILFGFLVSIAMLASSAFVLMVLVPSLLLLASNIPSADVIKQVLFTNMNKSLAPIELVPTAVMWTEIALDLSTIIFIFIGFFALTAAMMALGNHWDACYETTADCDHRGNPRLFNPIEQTSLGEATVFFGLLYIAAINGFPNVTHNHFYLSILAGGLVMFSGILSFCFGKRPDRLAMGTLACFFELLAFAASGGAIVLVTLGMVDDTTEMQTFSDLAKGNQPYKELLGMVIIGGALDLVLAINVIFVVGTIFRQFRQICCRNCCQDTDDEVDPYGSIDRRKYDSYNRYRK